MQFFEITDQKYINLALVKRISITGSGCWIYFQGDEKPEFLKLHDAELRRIEKIMIQQDRLAMRGQNEK